MLRFKKSFNYDMKYICADWRKKQAQSGRKLVNLSSENKLKKVQSTRNFHADVRKANQPLPDEFWEEAEVIFPQENVVIK